MNPLKLLAVQMDVPLAITLRGRLTCRCPVNGQRDYASVEVAYNPIGNAVELGSFAAYLATFNDREIGHEDVTAEIRSDLARLLEPDDLTVRTAWDAVEGIECVVVACQ